MEGVIPEVSTGYSLDGDDDSGLEEDKGGTGDAEGAWVSINPEWKPAREGNIVLP